MINIINDMKIKIIGNNGTHNRSNDFHISNEPLLYNWNYIPANNDINDSITIELSNNSIIKYINYDITTNTLPNQIWEYSHDGIQFNEFPFFSYIINQNSQEYLNLTQLEKDTLEQFQNKTIKLIQTNNTKLFLHYDLTANKIITVNTTLNNILNQYNNTYAKSYIFSYNESDIIKFVYQTNPIKFIKLNFNNLNITQESFQIKNLEILTEPILNYQEFKPSIYTTNLFKQKIFDEHKFIPSITKTFLQIMEQEI